MIGLTQALQDAINKEYSDKPSVKLVVSNARISAGTWSTQQPYNFNADLPASVGLWGENIVTVYNTVFGSSGRLYLAIDGESTPYLVSTLIKQGTRPGIYVSGDKAYVYYYTSTNKIERATFNLGSRSVSATVQSTTTFSASLLSASLFGLGTNRCLMVRAFAGKVYIDLLIGLSPEVNGGEYPRFVFPRTVISSSNAHSIVQKSAVTYDSANSSGFVYITNPDDGSLLGISFVHDADSASFSDTFIAIYSDLSKFEVHNGFFYWGKHYLSVAITRIDQFSGMPVRIMLMPGDGYSFAFIESNLVYTGSRNIQSLIGNEKVYFSWRNLLSYCNEPDTQELEIPGDDITKFSISERDGSASAVFEIVNEKDQYSNNPSLAQNNLATIYLGYGNAYVKRWTGIIKGVEDAVGDASRDVVLEIEHLDIHRLTNFLHPYYLEIPGRSSLVNMPAVNGDLYDAGSGGIPAATVSFDLWGGAGWDKSGTLTPADPLDSGGAGVIETGAAHDLGMMTSLLQINALLRNDPLPSGSTVTVKIYGWSHVVNSGDDGAGHQDAVIPYLIVENDGSEVVISGTLSGSGYLPQTWPTVQTGGDPITYNFTVDGVNLKSTSEIKRVGLKVSSSYATMFYISRINVENIIAQYQDTASPNGWVYSDSGYYELTHVGQIGMHFFQRPVDPRSFDIIVNMGYACSVSNESAEWGIACFAVDQLNFIGACYNRSVGKYQILLYRNGIPTTLSESLVSTWTTGNTKFMRLTYFDGLFILYIQSGDTWLQVTYYSWDAGTHGAILDQGDVSHCGVYGKIRPPYIQIAGLNFEKGETSAIIGVIPPKDDTNYGLLGSSGSLLINNRKYTYAAKLTAGAILGPYQCRSTNQEYRDIDGDTNKENVYGIDITLYKATGTESELLNKVLATSQGTNYQIDETNWDVVTVTNGVTTHVRNRSRHFAFEIKDQLVGTRDRAIITHGLTGVQYADISEPAYVMWGDFAYRWTDMNIKLHGYQVNGGEDDLTINKLITKVCGLAGATPIFNDKYYSQLVLETAYQTYLRLVGERSPDGFELEFTVPDGYVSGDEVIVKTDATLTTKVTGSLKTVGSFGVREGGSGLYAFIKDSENNILQQVYGVDHTEQVSVRIILWDLQVIIYMNNKFVVAFPLQSATYPSTGTAVGMLRSNASMISYIEDVYCRELSPWREAVPIDMFTPTIQALSTIIQERPIKVYPRQSGILVTYGESATGSNAVTPVELQEHTILRDKNMLSKPDNAASDYVTYYEQITADQSQDYADTMGFRSVMLHMPNLDEHEATHAIWLTISEINGQRNSHEITLARIHPGIEVGDLISFSYVASSTGRVVSASNLRVRSISFSGFQQKIIAYPDFDIVAETDDPSISYYLNDQFTTQRSVGAVNGTDAEPGPGTRSVLDTGSYLSINANGQLYMSAAYAIGDPAVRWLDVGVNRIPGMMMQFYAKSGGRWSAGLAEPVVNGTYHAFASFSSGILTVYDSNTRNVASGVFSTGTDYEFCVIVRNAGAFYYVKGGIYTSWTLVYHGVNGTYTVLKPFVAGRLDNVYADNFNIPDNRFFMPAPIISDSFSLGYSDGLAHPEGASGNLGSGGKNYYWTVLDGSSWARGLGYAACATLDSGVGLYGVQTAVLDQHISFEVTRSGGNAGGLARYIDESNHLRFYLDGTNAKLDAVVSGTPSTLVTGAVTYVAGAELRLVIVSATRARLIYNHVLVGETNVIPSALQSDGTIAGLYTTNTGNQFDDFLVYRSTLDDSPINQSIAEPDVAQTVVSVPNGADISVYVAQLKSGDILSLYPNGSYTLGGGVLGFNGLPSGYSNAPTVIEGNGATINSGQVGLYLLGRSHITIRDLNIRDQSQYCVQYDYCHHIIQENCTYGSDIGNDFVDVSKVYRSTDLEFNDCQIVATTGLTTCDGFEFWGPCKRVRVNRCSVVSIGGAVGDHHAFEVYGSTAGEESDDIMFVDCHADGVDVGYSVEGGAGSIVHTNIVCKNCTVDTCDDYDYQGIQGSTLYIEEHTGGTTNGTVIIRSYKNAKSWFVAVNGRSNAAGSILDPLDFGTAIGPSSPAKPGDVIEVRGGLYVPLTKGMTNLYNLDGLSDVVGKGVLTSYLNGSELGGYITIRCYDPDYRANRRAIINGGFHIVDGRSSYVILRNLDIYPTPTTRIYDWTTTAFNTPPVYISGNPVKLINCFFHDFTQSAYVYPTGGDVEIHGCLMGRMGSYDEDQPDYRGTCIYAHNVNGGITGGAVEITNNAFIGGVDSWNLDLQGSYGFINFFVDSNILYGGGMGCGSRYGQDDNNVFTNNDVYLPETMIGDLEPKGFQIINYTNTTDTDGEDLTFQYNYIVGGGGSQSGSHLFYYYHARKSDIQYNTIIAKRDGVLGGITYNGFFSLLGADPKTMVVNNNSYIRQYSNPFRYLTTAMTFANWKINTGFDAASTESTVLPTANRIKIVPNDYEVGRAFISIINWENATSDIVDLSTIGIPDGSRCRLRNCFAYDEFIEFGYDDSDPYLEISLDPNDWSYTEPIAWDCVLDWIVPALPDFGLFLIEVIE